MGEKISHITIDVGVNCRNTKDIWQRACFKISVNRARYTIEKLVVSIVPLTVSHANRENERNADFGEASGDPHSNIGVSQAACTTRDSTTT